MTRRANPTSGKETTDRPDNWVRDEMRPDTGEHGETPPAGAGERVAAWNERQMAPQQPDGSRSPGPSDEEIASSEGGLSGGGANPGGGERWAKREVEPTDD